MTQCRPLWLERRLDFAYTTGPLVRGPAPARHPAPGSETRQLGFNWCHPPRQTCPCPCSDDGASFLVDTGSSFSILPFNSPLPPSGPLLKAANGQRIPYWGQWQQSITLGGCRYSLLFLLGAVDLNILGVDFLQHFNLSVDVAAKQIWPTAGSSTAVPLSSSPAPKAVPATGPARVAGVKVPSGSLATSQVAGSTAGASHHQDLQLQEEALLGDFADVLNADGHLPPATHGVEHVRPKWTLHTCRPRS